MSECFPSLMRTIKPWSNILNSISSYKETKNKQYQNSSLAKKQQKREKLRLCQMKNITERNSKSLIAWQHDNMGSPSPTKPVGTNGCLLNLANTICPTLVILRSCPTRFVLLVWATSSSSSIQMASLSLCCRPS